MKTCVLLEGLGDAVVETGRVRIRGTSAAALRRDVVEELDRGASGVELCGGFGVEPLADVQLATNGQVPVGAVMYGFESLEQTVAFKRAFAAGDTPRAAFLFPSGSTPLRREVASGDLVVGVEDGADLGALAEELAADGVTLFELYAGLGPRDAVDVRRGAPDDVAVGLALYPGEAPRPH